MNEPDVLLSFFDLDGTPMRLTRNWVQFKRKADDEWHNCDVGEVNLSKSFLKAIAALREQNKRLEAALNKWVALHDGYHHINMLDEAEQEAWNAAEAIALLMRERVS